MHWIKATRTDIYLVQTPDEMAKSLELAYAASDSPLSAGQLLKVLIEQCPVPRSLLDAESKSPSP